MLVLARVGWMNVTCEYTGPPTRGRKRVLVLVPRSRDRDKCKASLHFVHSMVNLIDAGKITHMPHLHFLRYDEWEQTR